MSSLPSPSFQYWQPRYAAHGIPTFPVRVSNEGKVPAISGWQRIGLPGSNKLAQKFAGANALGFCPGRRSGLTILDVDTTDERVLADALDRHGATPVIVRSGSGNFQAWYRYNGETRLIRPERDKPIDILGSGFVVAPPSRGINGHYQFIEGELDDLDRLPVLRGIKIASPPPSPVSAPDEIVTKGNRNESLFKQCMRDAHHCGDLKSLLDVAKTRNAEYWPPLPDTEVVRTAKSAWGYTERGVNRFGQTGAWLPTDEVNRLIEGHPDDLALLVFLLANNGRHKPFMVANGLADKFGWGLERFRGARRRLEHGYLEMVRRPSTAHGPAMYRWRSRKQLRENGRGGVS